ncbi:hypothetical protein QAD02_017372 [Eretmocerus hayati]|uniref:Uncharacterized protein n=1 Tax=Eretmocerus hayati TaxID=131215 RepID=A0ACC2PDD2_9HYME|nr:hypothetical protein QAD02_017372 [Eretmocerus hayati]
MILVSIGTIVHGVYYNFEQLLDDRYFSLPTLLIIFGSVIFFIAFFGCCGAVRENYCMILTFATLMMVVLVLEMFVGVYAYVLRSEASEVITDKMRGTMKLYQNNTEMHRVWDMVQSQFKCCGTSGASDWLPVLHQDGVALPPIASSEYSIDVESATESSSSSSYVPLSCCSLPSGTIGFTECRANSSNLYRAGCLPVVADFVSEHALQLGGFGCGVALFQLFGIWFSIYLARSIKETYVNM